jgi:hypothetical protein
VWDIFCFDRRAVLVALILKLLAKCMDEVELSNVNYPAEHSQNLCTSLRLICGHGS